MAEIVESDMAYIVSLSDVPNMAPLVEAATGMRVGAPLDSIRRARRVAYDALLTTRFDPEARTPYRVAAEKLYAAAQAAEAPLCAGSLPAYRWPD
ncbi:MAG: hypothetical protein KGK07_14450 [Chloroflexota bacterium]|nr:hypothetical protein [Chloroflexota bacterium]